MFIAEQLMVVICIIHCHLLNPNTSWHCFVNFVCSVEKTSLNLSFFVYQAWAHGVQNVAVVYIYIYFAFFVAYRACFALGANNCDVFWSWRVKNTWRLQKKKIAELVVFGLVTILMNLNLNLNLNLFLNLFWLIYI